MIIHKILASYTFRFMSVYVAGLSVAVLIVLALVYAAFSYDYFNQLHSSVSHEINMLSQVYEQDGLEGVDRFVEEKVKLGRLNRFFYLVVDGNYNKLAGNLDVWPKFKQYGDGWLSFQLDVLQWDGKQVDSDFVARTYDSVQGYHLLAARHYDDVIVSAQLVSGALIRSMIVTIVLGTIGGAIVAGLSVKQIDSINKSVHRIMSGDLSERINSGNHQGDYRELTYNLNRMLDRIESLMEGVRQVSDNIAHDLRTPLTRLRNKMSQLQSEVEGNVSDKVQNLIDEADGLLSTFNALLRIAQVESGNRRAGFTEVDLKVILLDVVELYEPLAMDKSITITHQLPDHVGLLGDRDLLFQAFANLVDNAIKYTPEGGSLLISLVEENNGAVICVADSGVGIPGQDKANVFRRFFRVEASRGEQPGNGLGLSLVSAVMKLHQGEISLLDNKPGLKVQVSLPMGM